MRLLWIAMLLHDLLHRERHSGKIPGDVIARGSKTLRPAGAARPRRFPSHSMSWADAQRANAQLRQRFSLPRRRWSTGTRGLPCPSVRKVRRRSRNRRPVLCRGDMTRSTSWRRPGLKSWVGEGGEQGRLIVPAIQARRARFVLQRPCRSNHLHPDPMSIGRLLHHGWPGARAFSSSRSARRLARSRPIVATASTWSPWQ